MTLTPEAFPLLSQKVSIHMLQDLYANIKRGLSCMCSKSCFYIKQVKLTEDLGIKNRSLFAEQTKAFFPLAALPGRNCPFPGEKFKSIIKSIVS